MKGYSGCGTLMAPQPCFSVPKRGRNELPQSDRLADAAPRSRPGRPQHDAQQETDGRVDFGQRHQPAGADRRLPKSGRANRGGDRVGHIEQGRRGGAEASRTCRNNNKGNAMRFFKFEIKFMFSNLIHKMKEK